MKFAIRLFLMLLLFSTRETHAQTIIDLNNGGKVHAKALDDYDRKPEWKPEAKDSIEYADCLKRAFSALHCDSLAEAKHYFKSALKLQPTAKGNYIIELHLGNIFEVEEAYGEAEKHYTNALKLNPDLQQARMSRAAVAVQLYHFNEAKSDCDILLSQSPAKEHRSRLLFIRATALMGLRLNHEARKDLETLCILEPKNENAPIMLALSLHDEGRSQEALERLNIHLRTNPENSDALALRGSIHEALNLHDLALLDYDEAIRLDSTNASLYLERANCLEKLGKKSAAEKDRMTARSIRKQRK